MRTGLNGNVIWSAELGPDIDRWMDLSAVCVSEEGIITIAHNVYGVYPDLGAPRCEVTGLSMDGEVLWNHKTGAEVVNYLLPVKGGFLCVSQGRDTHNVLNDFLGEGWVLLLDADGNVKAADSTPDIGGGKVEVYGVARGVNGEALLYGTVVDEPGFYSK